MSDPLDALTGRVAADPGFLGHTLAVYQGRHNLTAR
jgi:hypothetical protein